MFSTYEPSGKFDSSIFLFALLGAALSVGLGWLYQLAIAWIPLIILNVLATGAFAFALYVGMSQSVEWGKCRNPILAAGLGAAIGLIGMAASHYFAYFSFIDQVMEQQSIPADMSEDVYSRIGFWKYIDIKVEAGYSISRVSSSGDGLPLSGLFVYLVWLVEAGIVVVGSAWGGWEAATDPYCESCDEWQAPLGQYVYPTPTFDVVSDIENATDLETIVEPDIEFADASNQQIVYEPGLCPSCDDAHFLTVALEEVTEGQNGEEVERTDIWENLEVSEREIERVKSLPERVAERSRELREREFGEGEEPESGDEEANAGDSTPDETGDEDVGGDDGDAGKKTPW